MTRDEDIAAFRAEAGWGSALTENMDADFSTRRFTRLHRDDEQTAILMDANLEQKTDIFVVLAWLLRGFNLSTPEIYAEKRGQGLVLMEDFGEGNVGRLIDGGCYENGDFYLRAAGVLAHLHQNFELTTVRDLQLPVFNAALFTKQAEKFLDSYMPHALKRTATEEERKSFRTAWLGLLQPIDKLPKTLMLRDFMPDNVMNLPERKSWRSLGLLDFQDAGIGPIAYDIASFCEVVRRDGGDMYLPSVIATYRERAKPACTLEDLDRACTLLAAQRHVRILGILGSIAQKDPTSAKLAYLPRVENYVKSLLGNEVLQPFKDWMTAAGLA